MSNPLRQHPFFQVANVNPDDPIRQIEQIEQLNTLLLQDIDHNFARFHDVVNNKILPQVKRYGIVSEPTREASQFWNTFFHAAAFGKTPQEAQNEVESSLHAGTDFHAEYEQTLDQTGDVSGSTIGPGHHGRHETNGNGHGNGRHEEDMLGDESGLMTPDEHSFLYGNPIASTPLPKHHLQHLEAEHHLGQNARNKLDQPWAEGMSSIESPYASLERKMQEVLKDDTTSDSYLPGEIVDTPKAGVNNRGTQGGYEKYETPEGMEEEPSVLISRTDSVQRPSESRELPDMPRFKQAQGGRLPFKSPKSGLNPFSPARPKASSSSSSNSGFGGKPWDGIADLRSTPLNPKVQPRSHGKKPERTPRQQQIQRASGLQEGDTFGSDSDSDLGSDVEGFPNVGTPPMTMNFGLPDRTIVSKTPAKEAAKAVIRNLMMDDEGMDSPGMPTPPAFSRYGPGAGDGFGASSGTGRRNGGGLFKQELEQRGSGLERGVGRLGLGSGLGSDVDSPLMGMTEPLPSSSSTSSHRPGQAIDPDVSTVGMPKHRRSTVPQLDFLDESFDDSLDEMPLPALPQGYVTENYGQAEGGQDSMVGHEEDGGEGEFTITEQQERAQFQRAGEDGTTNEVFGGAASGKGGMGGFALFGPDEMQTFHGGQLLDAAASPQDSPSYALGAKMANKRG